MTAQVEAVVLNITNDTFGSETPDTIVAGGTTYYGGVINGGRFRRAQGTDDIGSGSGVYRDLYRVTNPGGGDGRYEGYNRPNVMETALPGGFDFELTVGSLATDQSGNFAVFTIDINEPGQLPNRYLSLENFSIYAGGATDPAVLPATLAELDGAFTNLYSMDAGEDSRILMDYSLFTGSGTADLLVFIPLSLFEAYADDTQLYVYSSFGGDPVNGTPFIADSGHENIRAVINDTPGITDTTTFFFVPEPSTAIMSILGLSALLLRRKREAA